MCGPLPMDTGDETGNETGNPFNNITSHVSCSMGTCEVTDELVQYVLDYPDAYLNNGAIVVPYQPTGPVYGFQFTSVPAGGLADILGFEEDDVITKINNVIIADLGNWSTIASSLINASTMTVTYERSSTQHTLTITVEE
jgi:S1-C subfamily serine protease